MQAQMTACSSHILSSPHAQSSPSVTSSQSASVSFASFNGLRSVQPSSSGKHAARSAVPGRQSRHQRGAVVAMAAGGEKLPSLNELPLLSYINNQGRIQPPLEGNVAASVFAVFDKNKKIQYVGFSKDVRNSLRTLMGRRPEFCYYFKIYNLETMDQQKMLDIRSQWFGEVGIPPVGNTDPIQRGMWEKPTDAGSISERGKVAAAQSKARTLLQMMVDRGLKEEMEFDPALLERGLCDVLPSKSQSAEELAAAAAEAAEAARRTREIVEKAPGGEEIVFNITFANKIETNGGWMYDVLVSKDDKDTRHRIVCGRIYPESVNMFEDDLIIRVLAFLLHKRIPRQTEGVLSSDQFGINYFSVSQVAQKFDDFKTWFDGSLPETYWRFNRIHEYGEKRSPVFESPELFAPKY